LTRGSAQESIEFVSDNERAVAPASLVQQRMSLERRARWQATLIAVTMFLIAVSIWMLVTAAGDPPWLWAVRVAALIVWTVGGVLAVVRWRQARAATDQFELEHGRDAGRQ
jgi:protein-S-isoprenylcysteine O-methyltransferase Ste14